MSKGKMRVQNCVPNATSGVSNVADDCQHECSPSGKMMEKRKTEKTTQALPTTAQKNKKQPKIKRALRRARTLCSVVTASGHFQGVRFSLFLTRVVVDRSQ